MTDDEVYFFQHQLNAAEVWDFYTWSAEARRLESKLERAEAVIEAARSHIQYCTNTGSALELAKAIRQYDKDRDGG